MSGYFGDIAEDATIDIGFNTADTGNVPFTLAGSPVISVYKANDDGQSTSGVTLEVDADSLTGFNRVRIDASAAAFYAVANDYKIVITTGTVDGVSAVGRIVGEFSIENRGGIVERVWDQQLTGANHNISTSAGRRLRQIQENLGYANGAIWIDTANGTSGTETFENGTVDNPVDNIADANSLATSLGIARFQILPGSSIDFADPGADQENQEFIGKRWTLALGGRSVSGSYFENADVSGVCTGASEPEFFHCHMGAVTLPPSDCEQCLLEGTVTIGSAGDFFFEDCKSGVAGTTTPVLDFGSGLNASNANFRSYSGGIEIQNMGTGAGSYNMSLEGDGQLVVNANCSATSEISIRGHFPISGDATAIAAIAFSDDARFTRSEMADDVWDEIISTSAHNTAQSAGKRLRQLASVVIANDTAEVSNSPAINQIQLASGESSTDGTFDPGLVGLVGGTGAGQSRLILEYEGSTRLATLNRDWKVAPDGTTEYIVMASAGGIHVNEGLAQAGGASSITLNTLGSSIDDVYNGQLVFLVSGTGQDQVGRVMTYNGTTKVAIIETTSDGWATQPDATTGYIMLPILDIIANRFTGMTSMTEWLGLLAGKQAADATALTEIKATGAGSGTYSETTDSLEAIRNNHEGGGADTVTVNIKVGGVGLENAQVWITTDAAGANIFAGTSLTDSNGDITFLLDDGNTYFLWAQKGGFNLPQGESFVAEAD
jgi:hypothetical protein